jgi:hypothetical protein
LLKSFTYLLFFVFVVSVSLSGREVTDSTKSRTKTLIGIQAGLYLSHLSSITSPSGPPWGYTYAVKGGSNIGAGFSSGFFLEFKGEHSFTLQPELNFIWFSNDVQFGVVRSYKPGVSYYTDSFSTFIAQLCLLPKLSVRKKSNVQIMAGPFLNCSHINTGDGNTYGVSLQPSFGALACLRFNTKINSGHFGFDIRASTDLVPSASWRVTSLTMGLLYIFGFK